jgi:hypothetical protein
LFEFFTKEHKFDFPKIRQYTYTQKIIEDCSRYRKSFRIAIYHSGATGIDITALCNQKLSAPFTSELRVIEQFLKCG